MCHRRANHSADPRNDQWLKHFNVQIPVAIIHSGEGGRSVQERIGKWFDHQLKHPDPRGGILVVSHAAVLDMVPPVNGKTFDLAINEIPDVFSFNLKHIGFTHWWLTRYVTASAYRPGVLRLQPKDIAGPAYEKLQFIARNRPLRRNQAVYAGLAAAVLDPHKWVVVLEAQWRDLVEPHSPRIFAGDLDVLTILHPDRFKPWRSIMLMGARAHRTMLHLLWSKLFATRSSSTRFRPVSHNGMLMGGASRSVTSSRPGRRGQC